MTRYRDRWDRLLAFMTRHRVKIFDMGFIALLLAVAGLFAFEVDIFETEGVVSQRQETLELDELLVLTTLVMLAVLFYTWRRAREHQRENDRRIAAEKEVLTLALQDPLTGLPNRRQFDDALKSALTTVPAAPEAHAMLLLDLNGFKKINDLHGHPAGDQVLIHVGARLMRAVREGDLVARLGGDEFAVIARNVAGAAGATGIARRIIENLAAPIVIGTTHHQIGTAIGIALAPQDASASDELMRMADVALYRAKTEINSAVRFFEPEMDTHLQQRDELERSLRAGLEADAFGLRYQPASQADGRIIAFEVLPFWEHPTLGPLDPDRFLPIAEEIGALQPLVERLLRKACETAAAWPTHVRLSFNLPGALVSDVDFGLRILAVLGDSGFSPNRLSIEIDEGALVRDAERAQMLIAPLRSAGIAVVADHFGTGYSDLKNFRRLQLDGVKIDRSFVAAMTHDRQAAVMVKAMIGIAHGLDLSVSADGVGTEQQRAALEAQGCDQAQGKLFGGSLTAEQVMAEVAPKRPVKRKTVRG
jgi:diguanylate cyclase (GGDEF)-like protein